MLWDGYGARRNTDLGASAKADRAVVNEACEQSSPQAASIPCAERLYISFAEHGGELTIRKWSRRPFDGAVQYDASCTIHDIKHLLGEGAIADGSPEGPRRETGSVHDSGGACEGNRPRSYAQGVEAACTEIISLCRELIGEGKDGQET